MAITIPELNSVSVLDDTDNIMLTHSNGNSEKISGSAFKADIIKNKIENNNGHAVSVNAVSTIMATSTTITGPELGAGGNIKILFTSAIAGVDTSTGLTLTYNGSPIAVKFGKDGALENFCAYEVSTGVYRYLQAYTTLELVYDGTQFIIVGIPNIDNAPTVNSDNLVKSGGVYEALGNGANLIRAINDLQVGTSLAQDTDYIIAQTSGGGTNNYYRRTLTNVMAAALKYNGLEFGGKFIEFISINVPTLSFEQEGGGYTATFTDCYTFTHTFTSAPMVILLTQNNADYTYCAILGTEVSATKITKIKVMRTNFGSGVSIKIKGIAIG